MTISGEQAIDGIQDAFGRHPGRRVLHPSGVMLRGSFQASPGGTRLTRAHVMAGETVPVLARVSNGGGDPRVPDFMPDVRGLAVALEPELRDGRLDILAQTSPRMPVRTPEAFVEMMRALHPGIESLWRLPWFLTRRPRAAAEFAKAGRAGLAPPKSDATCRYHAEEIARRVAAEPVRFRLVLLVAGPGDDPHDPAVVWPDGRERVEAGVLTLLSVAEAALEERIVFDPSRVPDGIELSDDPLLRFRPQAYAVSAARRGLG